MFIPGKKQVRCCVLTYIVYLNTEYVHDRFLFLPSVPIKSEYPYHARFSAVGIQIHKSKSRKKIEIIQVFTGRKADKAVVTGKLKAQQSHRPTIKCAESENIKYLGSIFIANAGF